MKSVLRFLLFVLIAASAVGALYFWKSARAKPAAETNGLRAGPTNRPLLASLDREFTTLVGQVLPSVVSIEAIPANDMDPRLQMLRYLFGGGGPGVRPTGSGVIVSDQGHVVTNLHVVNNASAVQVQLADGRTLPAKFVGADGPSDIAILKIEAEGLQPLPFGDSDKVNVGQMVFAVGNPGLQETVTQGIISAKGRRALSEAANEFFQTDAAINPGSSGRPLMNLDRNRRHQQLHLPSRSGYRLCDSRQYGEACFRKHTGSWTLYPSMVWRVHAFPDSSIGSTAWPSGCFRRFGHDYVRGIARRSRRRKIRRCGRVQWEANPRPH